MLTIKVNIRLKFKYTVPTRRNHGFRLHCLTTLINEHVSEMDGGKKAATIQTSYKCYS